MSKHVTEWLSAYLDSELWGSRLHQVETHLAECEVCRAELGSLEKLSTLLQEVPVPELTPPDRFAAQVLLRLPHRQISAPEEKILEFGWWMIPVGLLGAWIFVSTSFLVGNVLAAASSFGLLASISDWMLFGSSAQASWTATLGRFGVLSGNSLDWATATEALTRTALPQIVLEASIALLYLSWIAIWWAWHQRQQQASLVES